MICLFRSSTPRVGAPCGLAPALAELGRCPAAELGRRPAQLRRSARGRRAERSLGGTELLQFWLITIWRLTVYLRVFLRLSSGFVHF